MFRQPLRRTITFTPYNLVCKLTTQAMLEPLLITPIPQWHGNSGPQAHECAQEGRVEERR